MARSIEEIIAQRKLEQAEPKKAPEEAPVEKVVAQAPEKEQHAPEATSNTPARKRRGVFNGTQLKLSVNAQIPGYHLHIFTDAGGRIREAQDGGWEFVSPNEVGGVSENVVSRNGDLGERVRFLVNPRAEGAEQYGYLMKQREEWWLEDQADQQARPNQIDSAIRKGKITGENPAFYQPSGGIKLT